jgi:predicted GTPase
MSARRLSGGGGASTLGLILLGNTGVGKSFIGNILLGRDAFEHECSSSSVTHETEFQDYGVGKTSYAIFNIPGLIEDDQEAVDRNKTEIYKAFQQRPNAVVAFVFTGGSGGRIRDEDLVAFRAINAVYQFQPESLLLIVNDLPPRRPDKYEGETSVKLERLLNIPHVKVCFLNRIDTNSSEEREQLRIKLIDAIIHCTPHLHEKHGDIELTVDTLKRITDESKNQQKEFEAKLATLKAEIDQRQREIDDYKRLQLLQPREIHHYHEKIVERESGGGCIIA